MLSLGLLFLSALNSRSILLDLLEFVFHSVDYYQFIINLASLCNHPLNLYSCIFNVPQGVLFVVQFVTMS